MKQVLSTRMLFKNLTSFQKAEFITRPFPLENRD